MKIKNFILLTLCLSYTGNFFASAQTDTKQEYEFSKNGFLAAIENLNEPLVVQFVNNPQMTLPLLHSGKKLAEDIYGGFRSKSQDDEVVITDLLTEGEEVGKEHLDKANELLKKTVKIKSIIRLLQNKITTMRTADLDLQKLEDKPGSCTDCVIA